MEEKNKKYKLKLRWKLLILFIISIICIYLFSSFIGTKGLEVKEYKVINNDLPASFYGLKIVHFSDLHYGRTIKEKELKSIVKKINITKPNIVVFTGDLIDKDIKVTDNIKKEIIKNFKNINSTYGNYFITGNHDRYHKDYSKLMKESNFINLNDNYDLIYSKKYESILIGGINSYIKKEPDMNNIKQYLKNKDIPKYKLLIMHVPDSIKYIKSLNFNLVLAGHSHNGQVRIPFIGALIKPEGAKKYYDEYYKVGNTNLYISSGLGTSTLNVRLFNKPSFSLYRLVDK